MAQLTPEGAPWPGAVAVSGGGDSLALMLLLAEWARDNIRPAPVVLTVDHGLRRDSAKDAKAVLRAAKVDGLAAHRLAWTGPKPKADIEAAARAARYRLMGEWCQSHSISALYVAHSREDLAETFLLRLARGSGLDGLAAMPAVAPFPFPGLGRLSLVRPLLGVARSGLRAFLAERGIPWIEDPMNADRRFARARLRAVWPALEEAGLSARRIADAALHLARARAALEVATADFLAENAQFGEARAFIDGAKLARLPREVGLRVLATVLGRLSGQAYRPRFERLERLFDALTVEGLGKGRTLAGCRIGPAPKRHARFGPATILVAREEGRRGRGAHESV